MPWARKRSKLAPRTVGIARTPIAAGKTVAASSPTRRDRPICRTQTGPRIGRPPAAGQARAHSSRTAARLRGLLAWPRARAGAAAAPTPTRLSYAARRDRPDPGLGPARRRRHGRPPDRPRPALDRAALPDLRHRRLLRARCPTANTSAATAATSSTPTTYNGLAVDIVPLDWRGQLRLDLARRSPGSPTGPSRAQNHPRPPVPLGRLRRRRRPRLRQPPAPLLEPRPGAAVPARRMGRSLPGQLPGRGPAARRRSAGARPRRAPTAPPAGSRRSARAASRPAATERGAA